MTTTIVDADLTVRDWLRGLSTLTTLTGSTGRIDFGTVADTASPSVVLTRVGGGDDATEAPVDVALIQLDCWSGSTPSRIAAAAVKNAIRTAIKTLRATPVATGTVLGARVVSDVFSPDPASDRPRYVLTVEFTIRPTT